MESHREEGVELNRGGPRTEGKSSEQNGQERNIQESRKEWHERRRQNVNISSKKFHYIMYKRNGWKQEENLVVF